MGYSGALLPSSLCLLDWVFEREFYYCINTAPLDRGSSDDKEVHLSIDFPTSLILHLLRFVSPENVWLIHHIHRKSLIDVFKPRA